jgi:hypothetical protein
MKTERNKYREAIKNIMIHKLKIGIFLLFVMMMISFVSSLDTYPGKPVNIEFSFCQTCQDATYITLSSIRSTYTSEGIYTNMTSVGAGEFCYNYTPTRITDYDFTGISDGCEKTFAVTVPVTYSGEEITSQEGSIYFVALAFLIIIIIGLGYLSSKISTENRVNEKGEVTRINFTGFLKTAIFGGIWIISLVCVFIFANVGIAFLPNAMIGNLFFTVYQILFWLTIIGIPVMFCLTIIKIVKAVDYNKMMEREGN